MKSSVKLRFCRWDLLVAAAIVALAVGCAAVFWLRNTGDGQLTAVVRADGQEIDRFAVGNLREKTYTNNGYTLRLLSRGGEVLVLEADCPNQDCVHTGFIDRPGESIVCLPARISVQLLSAGGSADGGIDAVIG